MNLFEKFVYALSGRMAEPAVYGWYHIMWLVIMLVATVLIAYFFKDASDKTIKKIMFIAWITIFLFEIYKETVIAFELVDGVPTWDYDWKQFPFQFCSTPFYILPLAIFLKDGKVRDACISYLATFGLFAGAIVMILPTTVLGERIGNNIQTMYHHSTMVVIGVLLLVVNRKKLDFKFLYTAMIVFCVCLLIALALNIIMHFALPETEESFNMFYIGPYESCDLPILSAIQPHVHPIVFILIYAIGFCIVSTIVFYIAKLVLYIKAKAQNK